MTRELQGWRALFVAFAAGALMALSFAPFDAWPVLFVSLPVFYLLLEGALHTRQSILRSFAFGYGYFMAGTWWIANSMLVDVAKFGWMIPVSILGLSGALAAYFILFGYLAHKLRSPSLLLNIVRFTVLWVAVEYVRSIGIFGFPWNLAGYAALASIHAAQLGSIIGTFGLSLLVVLAGVLPVLTLRSAIRWQRVAGIAGPVAILLLMVGYGALRLPGAVLETNTHVRIVQPNIAQAIKSSREGQQESLEVLSYLSGARGEIVPDITVWSETAYPFTLRDDRADMYPPVGVLVTGALRIEGAGDALKLFNSIATIDARGTVRATFDKTQLVPFGEFVPLRSVLPLEKITPGSIDFTRGGGPTTLTVDNVPPFSPLVCYEVVFPWLSVDHHNRPTWMVNVTNDGWYGDSPGPYQHFAMARMRAIEQGLPLVRAANSGISALVDPYGRVVAMLPLDVRGVLNVTLPKALPPTFYAKAGEMLTLLTIVFLWLLTYAPRLRRKA